ncbi:MAG: hypothetical protein JNL52_03395 [Flavobacteriales bacterium]|nr:hypothetical protein [Flavobacteriales bacterium]
MTMHIGLIRADISTLLIALVLLAGCGPGRAIEHASHVTEGEWVSLDRPYPYEARLHITDSSFDFSYGACMMQGDASGTVRFNGDTAILTSDLPKSCRWMVPFDVDGKQLPLGPDSLPQIHGSPSIPGCDADPLAGEAVIFEEELFIVRAETLDHVSRYDKVDPFVVNRFIRSSK